MKYSEPAATATAAALCEKLKGVRKSKFTSGSSYKTSVTIVDNGVKYILVVVQNQDARRGSQICCQFLCNLSMSRGWNRQHKTYLSTQDFNSCVLWWPQGNSPLTTAEFELMWLKYSCFSFMPSTSFACCLLQTISHCLFFILSEWRH